MWGYVQRIEESGGMEWDEQISKEMSQPSDQLSHDDLEIRFL